MGAALDGPWQAATRTVVTACQERDMSMMNTATASMPDAPTMLRDSHLPGTGQRSRILCRVFDATPGLGTRQPR
jgi:hypothetical protein